MPTDWPDLITAVVDELDELFAGVPDDDWQPPAAYVGWTFEDEVAARPERVETPAGGPQSAGSTIAWATFAVMVARSTRIGGRVAVAGTMPCDQPWRRNGSRTFRRWIVDGRRP